MQEGIAIQDRFTAWLMQLVQRLMSPIDIAPLVWFRILFGLLMMWEVQRYWRNGWIARYYIDPEIQFKYYGFHWVQSWPGDLMYVHFGVMFALAIMITAGLFYRIATTLFFLGYAYVFLLDSARYLNHAYLIVLISFIMIFIPAHRAVSLDARFRPGLQSDTVPAWALWWLRIQIGIVYTYAAIAKINPDWLRADPMRDWLSRRTDVILVGRFFNDEWMVYLFTYSGFFIDLLIFPALLWRKTMPFALTIGILFHLLNNQLFGIGVFPWFMIGAMVLFLPTSWLRLGGKWKSKSSPRRKRKREAEQVPVSPLRTAQYAGLALIAVYLVVQLAFPMRHHFYEGDVAWNEDGHRFSWRMMLRDKSGVATFHVTDPATGETWRYDPRPRLMSYQSTKVPTHPDMILQLSHYIAEIHINDGYEKVEVRADVQVSLNGRPREQFTDATVDLAATTNTFRGTTWITPGPTRAGSMQQSESGSSGP